jgi:hypothetical protein
MAFRAGIWEPTSPDPKTSAAKSQPTTKRWVAKGRPAREEKIRGGGSMSEENRVRKNTAGFINQEIDEQILDNVKEYAGRGRNEISYRIKELDREWDIERILEMNASAIALAGLLLGITTNKKWFFVPGIVLPFLFQHALQGWCPPVPVLRRFGVRTREEIDREKYALKALRGDFLKKTPTPYEAEQAAR